MKHGQNFAKKPDLLKEEMQRAMQSRRILGDKLVEKWARNEIGAKLDELYVKSPTKARNTAIAIHNQEKYLKSLSETVIATAFGTRPENLLKVVRIGSANSCRGDIFTEYPLQSSDDAIFYIEATYEQSLRDATAAQKMYENVNMYYAGEQVVATIDAAGAGTSYSVTISTSKPVVPYSVRVLIGGALVGNDDGAGNLTYTGQSTGANTIVYSTGAVVMNLLAAPNAKIEILYSWNSEVSTLYDQFGTIALSVQKRRFNARPMPLSYSFSEMSAIMFETTGLGNAEDLLIGAVGDEHAKSKDYKAIARARQIALGNTRAYFNADFAAEGEVQDKSHAQKLLFKIGEVSAAIYDDIKRGVVNKAVAGSLALNYMKKHDLWKDDTSMNRIGVYKAGTLSDIEVYACPADSSLVANNDILLTYKNPEEGMDLSIAFGVLTEISAQLKYPQLYTQGTIASVEDAIVFNTKFMRLLTINNL